MALCAAVPGTPLAALPEDAAELATLGINPWLGWWLLAGTVAGLVAWRLRNPPPQAGTTPDITANPPTDIEADHLADIVGALSEAIVGKTLDGTITRWSPGAERLFGYTADEAVGRPVTLIIPPELHGEETDFLARLGRGQRIDQHQTQRLRKNGQRVAVSLTLLPLRDPHGQVQGAIKVAHDLSGRTLADQALQQANVELERRVAERTAKLQAALRSLTEQSRYLDAFFQHAITPLVFLDRDFNFIRVNAAYARTCRKAVEDFPGHNHFELYPSEARAIFEEVVRTRQPYRAKARPFVFPDQPERGPTYWDWTLTPLLDGRGEVEFLVYALEDVTAAQHARLELDQHRHHLEALVREQTRELEAANARLQADIAAIEQAGRQRLALESTLTRIAATAPGVICSFRQRPDGGFYLPYASPAIEEIYNLRPEILAEDATPAFNMIHPDDVGHMLATIAESARTLAPWRDEWRVRHPAKGEIWIEGHAIPEPEPDGGILWYGFVHDITERKRAEEALREADRRKNEFLAMLGHELRNPLAPIVNAVKLMGRLDANDPRQGWARDVVGRQADYLARLVDDLLDVSRIVQGKLNLHKAPLDIAAVVNQAVETSLPLLETRHHVLSVAQAGEPIMVDGDRLRLAQVVSNLLNNAAKYTPEGGQVWLSVTRQGQEVEISVRDTGEGIPPQLLPYIFELFTQADRTLDRSQGGLGLGLTIVRNIVAMHGGRVDAYSAGPGRGSEFVVYLPALAPEAETPPAGKAGIP